MYAKFHHNIFHSFRDRAIFTISEFCARQSIFLYFYGQVITVNVGNAESKNYFTELGTWHLLENCNHSNKYIVKRIRQKLISKDEDKWKSELFNDRNNINGNKLRTSRIFKGNWKLSITFLQQCHEATAEFWLNFEVVACHF